MGKFYHVYWIITMNEKVNRTVRLKDAYLENEPETEISVINSYEEAYKFHKEHPGTFEFWVWKTKKGYEVKLYSSWPHGVRAIERKNDPLNITLEKIYEEYTPTLQDLLKFEVPIVKKYLDELNSSIEEIFLN